MKEYFNSILRYTAYLFAAIGITMLIGGGLIIVLIFIFNGLVEEGNWASNLTTVISRLFHAILPIAVLYIAMHRIGYKRNTTYEENPNFVKELLIPIIISSLIFIIVDISMKFSLSQSTFNISSILLRIFADVRTLTQEDIFEDYYSLLLLSTFLQSILQVFFMILGFYNGYKKRKKDRQEIISI